MCCQKEIQKCFCEAVAECVSITIENNQFKIVATNISFKIIILFLLKTKVLFSIKRRKKKLSVPYFVLIQRPREHS